VEEPYQAAAAELRPNLVEVVVESMPSCARCILKTRLGKLRAETPETDSLNPSGDTLRLFHSKSSSRIDSLLKEWKGWIVAGDDVQRSLGGVLIPKKVNSKNWFKTGRQHIT
jgi:hypothetical protein